MMKVRVDLRDRGRLVRRGELSEKQAEALLVAAIDQLGGTGIMGGERQRLEAASRKLAKVLQLTLQREGY